MSTRFIFSFLLVVLAGALCLVNINTAELQSWDEARRGINALRMLQTGDWWNYRFLDQTDDFNTKPPLFTWLLAICFKIWGVHIWALRLPSLIILLAFVVYLLRWLTSRAGYRIALMSVGILLSVNGIVGFHLARSGDTDMLFVYLLAVALGSFFRFLNDGPRWNAYLSVCAFLLAFFTKGLAVTLVLPGVLLYAWRRRASIIDQRKTVLLSVGLLLMGIGVTALLCTRFGAETVYVGGQENLWRAMWLVDGIDRFSQPEFEPGYQWDYPLVVLDLGFGPWIYVLYLAAILFPIKRGIAASWKLLTRDELLIFALCVFLSVLMLLMTSQNKHQWYMAPVYPFLAYATARLIDRAIRWKSVLQVPFLVFWVVLIGLKFNHFAQDRDAVLDSVRQWERELLAADALYVPAYTSQNLLFHLYRLNPKLRIETTPGGQPLRLYRGKCPDAVLGYCLGP